VSSSQPTAPGKPASGKPASSGQSVSPASQGAGSGSGTNPTSAGRQVAASMSDQDFVQKIARLSENWGVRKGYGPAGSGSLQGTVKHTHAKKLLERYQRVTGQKPDLVAERSYVGGVRRSYGTPGSARPDVYNRTTGEIFDYKFTRNPNPQISPRQQARNQANVPFVTRQIAIHP